MNQKRYAIIVAGGSGKRMNADTPKQFLLISGYPILMHTLNHFYETDPSISIMLVLPEDAINHWKTLCEVHHFQIPHQITKGGTTRFQSVRQGLALIPEGEGIVAVHDGVRMFAFPPLIAKCFSAAAYYGSAIPVMPVKESLRIKTGETSKAVIRDNYVSVQTPQCFDLPSFKKAYEVEEHADFTDDAAVWEHAGHPIHLIAGDEQNIKLTTPLDLVVAAYIQSSHHQ